MVHAVGVSVGTPGVSDGTPVAVPPGVCVASTVLLGSEVAVPPPGVSVAGRVVGVSLAGTDVGVSLDGTAVEVLVAVFVAVAGVPVGEGGLIGTSSTYM